MMIRIDHSFFKFRRDRRKKGPQTFINVSNKRRGSGRRRRSDLLKEMGFGAVRGRGEGSGRGEGGRGGVVDIKWDFEFSHGFKLFEGGD